MKRRFLLILTVSLAAICGEARAAFQLQPQSVRAASMGAGVLASAGEAVSVFTSPAGLAFVERPQASFLYSKLYAGLPNVNLSLGSMAFAMPTPLGQVGIGFGGFMAPGLKQERTLALGLAQGFFGDRLHVGVTGKQLHHSYAIGSDPRAASDPVFANGTSKSAFGVDLGASLAVGQMFRIGVSAQNLNEPDVGLASRDMVKRKIDFGVEFDLGGLGLKAIGNMQLENSAVRTEQGAFLPAFGVEKTLGSEGFVVRAGMSPLKFAGGFGVKVGRTGIDYALVMNRNLIADNFGTHQIGLTLEFGRQIDMDEFELQQERSLWRRGR